MQQTNEKKKSGNGQKLQINRAWLTIPFSSLVRIANLLVFLGTPFC